MDFEIGQVVRVKQGASVMNGTFWHQDMEKYIGMTSKIIGETAFGYELEDAYEEGVNMNGYWHFAKEWLELAENDETDNIEITDEEFEGLVNE